MSKLGKGLRILAGQRHPKAVLANLRWMVRVAQRDALGVPARLPGGRRCALCQRSFFSFVPTSSASATDRELKLIGSDLSRFWCPHCFSTDRERHLRLYFGVLFGEVMLEWDLLHFAPESMFGPWLSERVRSYTQAHYDVATPTEGIDIRNIPWPSQSFDVVIANHVLEHVIEDRHAMAEVWRVLRPGGVAILQTPYSPLLSTTLENPGVATPEARLQIFGQADHVRVYGLDLLDRLRDSGFAVEMISHESLLAGYQPETWGVNASEPLLIARKLA